ncbi:MAG: SMC-Scp complex subunit ScpB [Gemmataceae bacterium]|nr:SMC-Scp complex subunit ScpB [Gemmataceae bacterium]MCI0740958.1 SMC-Scp complex subunit ScpB [Gemmataceae bacterium]
MSEPAEDLRKSYASLLRDRDSTPAEVGTGPADAAVGRQSAPQDSPAPPSPTRIVEALLFVGGEPLTATRAGEIIRGMSAEQFTQALDGLNRAYRRQGRPYAIVPKGDGYVLALRSKHRGIVEKVFGGPREARLSNAAVDVLALVAYRQPATRGEVDNLRGADSTPLLRQLVRRGLIQVVYRADAHEREVSYGTSPRFLELFGLRSLDDLPRVQDLQVL